MKDLFLLLCAALPFAHTAYSQAVQDENLRTHYGLFSDFNWNVHRAEFRELPGIPNCCPSFDAGQGFGFTAGILHELPLSASFSFDMRGNLSVLDAALSSRQQTTVIVHSDSARGMLEHSIRAQLASIGFEPMLSYNPIGRFHLHAGLRAGVFFRTKFSQKEELLEPQSGLFENGRRIRNEAAGVIPNANTIQLGFVIGASHEAPLNRDRTLFLAPEVFYQLSFTPVAENVDWNANSLRFGLALKYAPFDRPTIIEREFFVQPKNTRLIAFTFFEVKDTQEIPLQKISLLRSMTRETRPLLSYIFFDENSSRIPSRYRQLSPAEASRFTEERTLADTAASENIPSSYYHVLNIIGSRMKRNPSANIVLSGYSSGGGTVREDPLLGRDRAQAVAEYLRSVWGIDSLRMQVRSRTAVVFARLAGAELQLAEVENRRVEIFSDNEAILAPVIMADTAYSVRPAHIRIKPLLSPSNDVDSWRAELGPQPRPVRVFEGTTSIPQQIEWRPDPLRSFPANELRYSFNATTIFGLEFSQTGSIAVEKISQAASGNSERFNLILFEYGSAELSDAARKMIPRIRENILPSSRLRIVGYTDRLGDAAVNKSLSLERARKVAEALGVAQETASGAGEEEIFDNSYPEGRFYNRTVRVIIEQSPGG